MASIAASAEAGAEIIRRLASGELEIHGILLRDVAGKRFRYILRGLEQLPGDAARLPGTPLLTPLRSVMTTQQISDAIVIAQNVGLAATLQRVEIMLDEIRRRFSDLQQRLGRIDEKLDLLLAGMRNDPVARLKAAKNLAANALRYDDRTALMLAAKEADQAAQDILGQARHLAAAEVNGVFACLQAPTALEDLVDGAVEAVTLASAIHLALGSTDLASQCLDEAGGVVREIRTSIREKLTAPGLLPRRLGRSIEVDRAIAHAGVTLTRSIHRLVGRAALISAGLIVGDGSRVELERASAASTVVFEEIDFHCEPSPRL